MNKVSFVIIMVGLLLGALALRGANASNSSMALNGSRGDYSHSDECKGISLLQIN